MSRKRYRWWGYVKAVLRIYPEHCGTIQAGGALQRDDLREYEAVRKAIDAKEQDRDGAVTLEIIEMVYFKGSHTLQGAADAVGYSYGHAKRIQEGFLLLVARNLGLCGQ
ncbi:MAG: hypothetical protein LUE91_05440 [Oscillospiraceae bacterium]|nr:hypothetical protein [Oscillospiraceae bacterium]